MKATRICFSRQNPLRIKGFPAFFTSYIREWAAHKIVDGDVSVEADMYQMYSEELISKYSDSPALSANAIYMLATEENNGRDIPDEILLELNIGVCTATVPETVMKEEVVIVSNDYPVYDQNGERIC